MHVVAQTADEVGVLRKGLDKNIPGTVERSLHIRNIVSQKVLGQLGRNGAPVG